MVYGRRPKCFFTIQLETKQPRFLGSVDASAIPGCPYDPGRFPHHVTAEAALRTIRTSVFGDLPLASPSVYISKCPDAWESIASRSVSLESAVTGHPFRNANASRHFRQSLQDRSGSPKLWCS